MGPGVHFEIPPISHDFVVKQLKELDPTKAIGMDGLASYIVRVAAHAIVPTVTKVIKLRIASGTFMETRQGVTYI